MKYHIEKVAGNQYAIKDEDGDIKCLAYTKGILVEMLRGEWKHGKKQQKG